MIMPQPDTVDTNWKMLYRVGGAAPLLTVALYLSEFLFIQWEQYPTSMEDWFALLQQSKLLGLFYLNAQDIFSIALLGVMFLALFVALKPANPALMLIATFFALLGVGVFVVPRTATLSLLPLSDHYATATAEAARSQLLSAGEAIGALLLPTPQTIGFLFMAIAVLMISVVMLQGNRFERVTALFGILASAVTIADHMSIILAPTLASSLMILSGLFWIPWWLMIGWRLLQFGRTERNAQAQEKLVR